MKKIAVDIAHLALVSIPINGMTCVGHFGFAHVLYAMPGALQNEMDIELTLFGFV